MNALTVKFYADRPLPETLSAEELNQYLTEDSRRQTEMGRETIRGLALRTSLRLRANDSQAEALERWGRFSRIEREEAVLSVVAQNAQEMEKVGPWFWQLKLVPEVSLNLAEDGAFEAFLSRLSQHILDDLSAHPFPEKSSFASSASPSTSPFLLLAPLEPSSTSTTSSASAVSSSSFAVS
jgi:hypothetical protein